MPTVRMPSLSLRRLTTLAAPSPTDADLLARFVATRDDQAFAELVRRHGPMVLAVCRRVTSDPDDAEDAFQAAFLVLARKADRVRPAGAVGGWLYGVAVRAARAAVARAARRRARETPVADVPDMPDRAAPTSPDPETIRAVMGAVAGLSEPYRAAVVLCELEGRSRAAAARELGIPEGTLSSRLAAARRALAARLRGRDLAALAVVAGAATGSGLAADVRRLARASAVPSPKVEKLAEMVMRTTDTRWHLAGLAATLMAVGLAAAGGPVPQPGEAPAPKPARADTPSQLIVGIGNQVRYLTPDGKEIGRLDDNDAVKAGADVATRAVAIGIGTTGLTADYYPIFPLRGRAAPDGRLPVETQKGFYLLSAGPPVSVRPVKAAGGDKVLFDGEDMPRLVAWSPDGRWAVGERDISWLLPITRNEHTLVDTETGTVEPLALPPEHYVVDWSADGTWFLTILDEKSLTSAHARMTLCRTSRDGKTVKDLASGCLGNGAISPDGTRVAYLRLVFNEKEVFTGFEVVVLDLITHTKRVIANEQPDMRKNGNTKEACMPHSLRWSPGGTQLTYAYGHHGLGKPSAVSWRVAVCGADGAGNRTILATDSAEKLTGFTLLDWR